VNPADVVMDIHAALEREHSKALSLRIARHIGTDPGRFSVLMGLMMHGTPRIIQRAAWPMGMACEAHPALATPWLPQMLDALDTPVHEAVHRNIVRTLQFCALPETLHGRLTDVMFTWIASPERPIAPRASAITVAMRLVGLYPELAGELRSLLEDLLRKRPPPALRSRGTHALGRLERMRDLLAEDRSTASDTQPAL
jgi:hypothetical protein